MKNEFRYSIRKTALTAALCLLLPSTTMADIYKWGAIGGPTSNPATCDIATSPDAAEVTFTMIEGAGAINLNGDSTFNFGEHTITCGSFTYNTKTTSGSAEIVGFNFTGAVAEAKAITLDLIPSALAQGNTTFMLANMLFDWNGNLGIPVSIVYDAQGILTEMDNTAVSFTLLDDGNGTNNADPTSTISITQTSSSPFANIGATPSSDGTSAFNGLIVLNQGPKPIAGTLFNTPKISGIDGSGNVVCVPGADADFTNNTGGGCMGVSPSADITSAIITDVFDNTAKNPGNPTGLSGDPMLDGPFTGFNANFSFDNMKLISFVDETPPGIALSGSQGSIINHVAGETYVEDGATCTDAPPLATNLNGSVIKGGDIIPVPLTTAGSPYTVTYDCQDASGNIATQKTRTINVVAANAPVISLNADVNGDVSPVTRECAIGGVYADAGASCLDPEDGNITGTDAPLAGNLFGLNKAAVDIGTPGGPYIATWSCRDSNLATTTQDRGVNVVDTTPPLISINPALEGGTDIVNIVSSTPQHLVTYNDQGASATDACDASVGVTSSGAVDVAVPDTGAAILPYVITYVSTDASLNKSTLTRTVNVARSQPVISLVGGNLVLNVGEAYTEQGMDITDVQQGNLSGVTASGNTPNFTYIIDASAVNTSATGAYTVTYDVTDIDGNIATQVKRLVTVGIFASGSNFTMLTAQGNVFGGTNDVTFDWDQTTNNDEVDYKNNLNFNMTIASQGPFPFFGFPWTAHDTRVFGPGTYSFDTGCTVAEIRLTGCPAGSAASSGPAMSMTVGPGQLGAHILFDWNTSSNIDVVNVWDVNGVWNQHGDVDPKNQLYNGQAGLAPDPATTWKLVSRDVNGDGVNASPMVDGPFQGFYANFNAGPGGTAPPPTPYTGAAPDTKLTSSLALSIWGLFTGLVALLGFRRFSKK